MLKRLYLMLLCLLLLSSCYRIKKSDGGGQGAVKTDARAVNPADVVVPPGYRVEAIATGLTFPTGAAIDDQGQVYVVESGYAYGEIWLPPRLLRIGQNGTPEVIAAGERNGPWNGVTYHNGNFYVAEGNQLEGGKILRISPDGTVTALIDNLPSLGDHHTNGPAIGPDGYLYFGQGTATNSGIVGPDNADYGWLKRFQDFHDIPCQDVVLAGRNIESISPLESNKGQRVSTGPYLPYGTPATAGQVVQGQLPCSGSIMRISLDGGAPELVAWGMRNPFGLAFSPDGRLYVTDNSYDVRGSRPVWGTGDYLWAVQPGTWYGWPDYSGGTAFNGERFGAPGKEAPAPVLQQHPSQPPKPAATLGVHSSSNGFDFSSSSSFGYAGEAFVAQFGDMAPKVGKVMSPVGYKVVRVDVQSGAVTDFAINKGKDNGPASKLKHGGLERPVSARFSPDGNTLYIVDFGIMQMPGDPRPIEKTGVIWKITKTASAP